MECSQIHKQMQPFLGDLLSEEERHLFLEHLEGCVRCRPYVRSIGDLSNQIWKLGDVEVPDDFSATVLFKLSHPVVPEAHQAPPRPVRAGGSRKYMQAGIVLVLVAAVFLMKPVMTKLSRPASAPGLSPSVAAEAVMPQAVAASEPPVQPVPAAPATPAVAVPEKPTALIEPKSPPAAPQPLHWHLTYASGADHRAETEKRRQSLLQLQALRGKAESLKSEFKRLEDEGQHALGQVYSEEETKAKAAEKVERDAALAVLVKEMSQLDLEIKRSEEEGARIEREWRDESAEKKRRDARTRSKILDMLVVFDAKFQYQAEGFVIFSVASEKLDHVLENMLPVFQQAGEFQDFGASSSGAEGQEQCVSLYLDQGGVSDLHWHVSAASPGQKVKLSEAVRELGGSEDYDSDGVVVFSVPRTALKELEVRVKAMRIPMTAFGRIDTADGAPLSNAPIKISVYFSK